MLVVKKINQKKTIVLAIIGLLMVSGIIFFIYKNYTLTNIDYSEKTFTKLEPIALKKEKTDTPIISGQETGDSAGNQNSSVANEPSEHDFINKKKWRSLIKTDYNLPDKITTGNKNPYQIEKK